MCCAAESSEIAFIWNNISEVILEVSRELDKNCLEKCEFSRLLTSGYWLSNWSYRTNLNSERKWSLIEELDIFSSVSFFESKIFAKYLHKIFNWSEKERFSLNAYLYDDRCRDGNLLFSVLISVLLAIQWFCAPFVRSTISSSQFSFNFFQNLAFSLKTDPIRS